MESSWIFSIAPPLKCPMPCASTTVPRALAPAGMTSLPSTTTGSATVASKLWPGWLIFEPRASPKRTLSTVPSGTVYVLLVRRSISPGGLGAFALLDPEDDGDELLSRFSVLVAFSAGGLEPQPRMTARQNRIAISFTRIERYPPQSEAVVSPLRVREQSAEWRRLKVGAMEH